MNQTRLRKYWRLAILLIIINFLSIGSALGQTVSPDTEIQADPEIFPFASSSDNTFNSVANLETDTQNSDTSADTGEVSPDKYTENVYEVTDDGVYDPAGNLVKPRIPDSPQSEEDSISVDEEAINTMNQALNNDDSQDSFEAYKESIIANWGGKVAFTKRRLEDIQMQLEKETENFTQLGKQIDDIEIKLEPTKQQINTLEDEMDLLNRQLALAEKKIQNTDLQIAEKEVMLRKFMEGVENSEAQLNAQKEIVLNYITLVYQEEERFIDYDKASNTLKLLLADNSVSENLLGIEYSSILEQTGRKVFYDLFDKQLELQARKDKITEEKSELDALNHSLDQEKRLLNEGKQAKKNLLEQTRGLEEEYQKLLEESIQQQLESAIAIQNMKDNVEFINQKLDLLDESVQKVESLKNTDVINGTEAEVKGMQEEIQQEFASIPKEEQIPAYQSFIWPVTPNKITAYFHDPLYPKRWGIHNAMDIRAKQYTEIHAPANGYVFQTKDNGMGYSYIILAHKNKLVTVYGHVSEILVKPGTVVKQGDLIGLTGGMPGTKGAGWQTTGPHLHFEVWHDGEQVDPLDWLPVMELPIEYIPDRFLTVTNSKS